MFCGKDHYQKCIWHSSGMDITTVPYSARGKVLLFDHNFIVECRFEFRIFSVYCSSQLLPVNHRSIKQSLFVFFSFDCFCVNLYQDIRNLL